MEEIAFQFGEPALGCVNQAADRGIIYLPVIKRLFDGNAAIHHPDSLRFAILRFNLLQESLECDLVGGIPRQHFVGEREAIRGDDPSDDGLCAVGTFIAVGTIAELVAFAFRWWRFERGAGEVLE